MTEKERRRLELEDVPHYPAVLRNRPIVHLYPETRHPHSWRTTPEPLQQIVVGHGPFPDDRRRFRGGAGDSDGSGFTRITIYKQAVFDDVDAQTYRRTNVGLAQLPKEVKYETAADSREPFDKGLLTRYALFWDARLRLKLQSCLNSDNSLSKTDDYQPLTPELIDKAFVYDFNMDLDDNMKTSLTEHIHRFLVLGCIYNWFRDAGLECEVTKEELDEILDDIRSRFRTGFVQTPLQPFDPKHF